MGRKRFQSEPIGPAPYLEREPSALGRLLFFLSGIAFVAAVLGGVWWMYRDLGERILPVILEWGWAGRLELRTPDPFEAGIRCYFHLECNRRVLSLYPPNYYIPLYTSGGALLLAALASKLVTVRARTKTAGTARWASKEDLKELRKGRQAGYVGFLNDGGEGKERAKGKPEAIPFPERLRNGHFAVLGGPGAGKTTAFYLPNLLLDAKQGNTAVVFDFKFPDPEGLGECLSYFQHYGRRIYVFTPFEPFSMTLPLLEGGHTREGALDIAEMLVPKRRQPGPDEFYRDLDRALIATLVYAMSNDPQMEPMSPGKLMRKILEGPQRLSEYVSSHRRREVREWSAPFIQNLTSMARDKVVGLHMGLASRFILFDHPRLDAATSNAPEGRINLKEVFREPSLLYIGIPQVYIQGGKGQVLLQLVKRLLDRAILEVAHANGGKLPIHAAIYLDEFPNFGPLPNMSEVLATMRSRRVSYLLSFQDHAQGYAVYGQEEFEAMFGTIQNLVAFPSRLSKEDRKWLSEHLGHTASLERSYTETGRLLPFGTFERRGGETIRETRMELLTVDEMQTFPQEEAVVVVPGIPPIRAYMPYIYADGKGERKDLMPHPWHRERARALRYKPMDVLTVAALKGGGVELPQVGGTKDALVALFSTWVERLVSKGIKVAKREKEYVLAKLPRDLDLAFVEEWIGEGWLAKEAEGYRITEEGMGRLPERIRSLLKQMHRLDPVIHLVRKQKREGGDGVAVVEEPGIWILEEVAQSGLPSWVMELSEVRERNGQRWRVFRVGTVLEI